MAVALQLGDPADVDQPIGRRQAELQQGQEALAAGILMRPRLSLIIAAAAIGEKLGIIDDSVNAAIVLVAIVTVTASPLAFLRLFPAPLKVARAPITDAGLTAP